MKISEVIRRKGDAVETIEPHATVADLVELLGRKHIGAVVVRGPTGMCGIVSERDVVRSLAAQGEQVIGLPVSEIASSQVHTCEPDEELAQVARRMTDLRVRHLPVLQEGEVVGIVSLGDVVKNRLDEVQMERDSLLRYVSS